MFLIGLITALNLYRKEGLIVALYSYVSFIRK